MVTVTLIQMEIIMVDFILGAKPGIELEDLTPNDLVRFCVGAVCEHETVKDPSEAAAMVYDLRSQGGPSWSGDGLEVELYGNTYRIMDTDLAEAQAKESIEEYANDQWRELSYNFEKMGITSSYISFNDDMFIRDCMMDWGTWLGSYDDVVNEYFPKSQWTDKVENFGCFSIWRTD